VKICIDIGHNIASFDTGAVGYESEDIAVEAIGLALQKLLIDRGHQIKMTQPIGADSLSDSLTQRVKQSNDFGSDLFISLHCNAATTTQSPRGTEVWAYSDKVRAAAIEKRIAALGLKSRGVKTPGVDGDNLQVLRDTNCPALLVEHFFVDSKADVDLWNKLGADKFALAIADAVSPIKAAHPVAVETVPSVATKTSSRRTLADVLRDDENTSALVGLNRALIAQARSLGAGLVLVDNKDGLLDISDAAVNMALQPKIAASLTLIAKEYKETHGKPLKINSCYRTAVQQICLYQWAHEQKNGIELAAMPGSSNHELGNAVDVPDWQNSASIFKKYGWIHQLDKTGSDPVHFEMNADGGRVSILALQKYWNQHNPNQQLAEDGMYGDKTRSATLKLPIDGYE
jgi:hypothetical protein